MRFSKHYRWRRGQEELIEGLFFWLGTPLLKLAMETCRPVFTPIANGLIRYEIDNLKMIVRKV